MLASGGQALALPAAVVVSIVQCKVKALQFVQQVLMHTAVGGLHWTVPAAVHVATSGRTSMVQKA